MFHFYSHINMKLVSFNSIKVIYVILTPFPRGKNYYRKSHMLTFWYPIPAGYKKWFCSTNNSPQF